MLRAALLVLLASVVLSSVASARVWYIRPDGTGDAPTIKAAVDSAARGDTLILADGIYQGEGNKNITLAEKAVRIQSESGNPENCIIDCGGSGTFFSAAYRSFYNYIVGITIRNCAQAIYATWDSNVGVYNCIIENCTGYALETSKPAGSMGGYISVHDCVVRGVQVSPISTRTSMNITGSLFYNNNGFIQLVYQASCQVTRCTVVNCSGENGLIRLDNQWSQGSANVSKSIFAFNSGTVVDPYVGITLGCCDVYGNTGGDFVGPLSGMEGVDGNFSADPRFCDIPSFDFSLEDCSPCLPGNHPDGYDCGSVIGALGVGCECGTPTQPTTWGGIKSLFR